MKRIKPFEEFMNESRSGKTVEDVKKVLDKMEDHPKRMAVSVLVNDDEWTDEEVKDYFVNHLEIDPKIADELLQVMDWFRLDYMDYCNDEGTDEGLFETK